MSFLHRTFSSGLSGREIDRHVLQEEAKKGWQSYSDIDLRPWHSLVDSWRSNRTYRTESRPGLLVRIVKASMFYPTAALVLLLVGLFGFSRFVLCRIAQSGWEFLGNKLRLFTKK